MVMVTVSQSGILGPGGHSVPLPLHSCLEHKKDLWVVFLFKWIECECSVSTFWFARLWLRLSHFERSQKQFSSQTENLPQVGDVLFVNKALWWGHFRWHLNPPLPVVTFWDISRRPEVVKQVKVRCSDFRSAGHFDSRWQFTVVRLVEIL